MSHDDASTRPTRVIDAASEYVVEAERLSPGQSVGRYVVREVIASGGMGTVYRAGRAGDSVEPLVALKVIHPRVALEPSAVSRFHREVEVTRGIEHASIVRVFDSGTLDNGLPYYTMELLEGESLADRIRREGAMSPGDVLAILDPICDAVSVVHARHVVHRDIKASNVFLRTTDTGPLPMLIDFGVAKLLDTPEPGLTRSFQLVGTLAAMSPEQLSGETVDERSDIYMLGVLAFHMLTGAPPFGDRVQARLKYMHLHAPRPRPSQIAKVPPVVDDVVMRAMSRAPDRRYASAQELRAALASALASTAEAPAPRRTVPAVAVLARARVTTETLPRAQTDRRLAERIERAIDDAIDLGVASGLTVAFETGTSVMLVRELPPGSGRARDDAMAALDEVAAQLREDLDVTVHAADAIVEGIDFVGGPLMEVERWAPGD